MDITPFFGIVGDKGIVQIDAPDDPTEPFLIGSWVSRRFFDQNASFRYLKYKDGTTSKSWWIDGMQAYLSSDMLIFTKDPELELVAGYNFQNSEKHFVLLGRLEDGHEFTERYRSTFRTFLGQLFG